MNGFFLSEHHTVQGRGGCVEGDPVPNGQPIPLRALAALVFFALSSCAAKDDVAEVRKMIREGAVLAEKHDMGGMIKLTTADFQASPGPVSRQEVKRYLLHAFMRYKEFRVLYSQPDVEIQDGGDRAGASFPFLIVQKDQSLPNLKDLLDDPESWIRQLGDKADLYRLRLELAREGGDWRVRRAHLEVLR
jgi:hypothetical protein